MAMATLPARLNKKITISTEYYKITNVGWNKRSGSTKREWVEPLRLLHPTTELQGVAQW